jgi:hypothetical protein
MSRKDFFVAYIVLRNGVREGVGVARIFVFPAHPSRVPPPGESKAALRRLAREHPDILERYQRGEFKSPRAAAIAAEIIKPKLALEQARKALPKLTDIEWGNLKREEDERRRLLADAYLRIIEFRSRAG